MGLRPRCFGFHYALGVAIPFIGVAGGGVREMGGDRHIRQRGTCID